MSIKGNKPTIPSPPKGSGFKIDGVKSDVEMKEEMEALAAADLEKERAKDPEYTPSLEENNATTDESVPAEFDSKPFYNRGRNFSVNAELSPSNWTLVKEQRGPITLIEGRNGHTGSVFRGTMKQFNEYLRGNVAASEISFSTSAEKA